ncbi:uncharacterized protein RHO17_017756 [Thomomys bottae]
MAAPEKEARRQKINLSQSQQGTLWAWFKKNPYPDLATKEHLAREIGIADTQIYILIQAFNKNRFPGLATWERLARKTGITESRIQRWFQNRRFWHPGKIQESKISASRQDPRWVCGIFGRRPKSEPPEPT